MEEKFEDMCVIICKTGNHYYPKYVKLQDYENEVKNHNKIDGIEIVGSCKFPEEKYNDVSNYIIGMNKRLDNGESVDVKKELEKFLN